MLLRKKKRKVKPFDPYALPRIHYIYVLRDPFSKKVRYVGFTSYTLEERLKWHVDNAMKLERGYDEPLPDNRKDCWIVALSKHHVVPIIEEVARADAEDAHEAEALWIGLAEWFGVDLLNAHSGGKGKRRWTRRKIDIAERFDRCENPNYIPKKETGAIAMSNVRVVYQLRAVGDSLNGWAFRIRSKAIFSDREAADRFVPEFSAMCCDRSYFECADPATLKVEVDELEFYE